MTKFSFLGTGALAIAVLSYGGAAFEARAQQEPPAKPAGVDLVGRSIKAINYQHRGGATKIDFAGTDLMSGASGQAKVESKRGYLEIEVEFRGLPAARTFGPEYFTYVLWAITPEGRAANLGEVLLKGDRAKLNVTTQLQAFGLVVTAEPYFSVTYPSDVVVLENVVRGDTRGRVTEIEARYDLLKRGQYVTSEKPDELTAKLMVVDPNVPLQLYEARNAVRIARWTGAEKYAKEAFDKSVDLLLQAERYQARKRPDAKATAMMARQAVQTAEDARLLAVRRANEEQLALERKAAAAREAEARAKAEEEGKLRAKAMLDLQQADRQRIEAEAATARANQIRQEAEAAAQLAGRQRIEAEEARMAALADAERIRAEAKAAAEREAVARAKAESEASLRAKAETGMQQADRLRAEAMAAAAEANRVRQEAEAAAELARTQRMQAEEAKTAALAEAERVRLAAQNSANEAEKARLDAKAELDRVRAQTREELEKLETARSAAMAQKAAAESDAEKARMAAAEANRLREQVERERGELRQRLQTQLNKVLETSNTARGLIVNMSDVLFDTAQFTLRAGAREKLARISGIIVMQPGLKVEVEGHTDSVGGTAYNQQLSEQRADAVRTYLIEQGIEASAITAKGFGKTTPKVSNDTAEGRQQNRRVELVVSGSAIGTTD